MPDTTQLASGIIDGRDQLQILLVKALSPGRPWCKLSGCKLSGPAPTRPACGSSRNGRLRCAIDHRCHWADKRPRRRLGHRRHRYPTAVTTEREATVRAKISEELSAVRALSPPVNDSQAQIKREDELVAAQVRLRSAAMLAHLPRKLVEEYSRLTAAALHSSKESLAANGRGSVPGAVAECLDAAHQLMSDLLWQPVRTRIRYPFRFWWLRRRVTQTS